MVKRSVFVVAAVAMLTAAYLIPLLTSLGSSPREQAEAQAGRGAPGARPAYSFRVEIEGVDAGQFDSVDGLSLSVEPIEYREGQDASLTRKLPGPVNYGNITLKKGYIASSDLNDWIEEARFGNLQQKSVSIVLINKATGDEVKRWNCFGCFPKSWKVSGLDGKGNDVLTEEMVIVIEWFEEA